MADSNPPPNPSIGQETKPQPNGTMDVEMADSTSAIDAHPSHLGDTLPPNPFAAEPPTPTMATPTAQTPTHVQTPTQAQLPQPAPQQSHSATHTPSRNSPHPAVAPTPQTAPVHPIPHGSSTRMYLNQNVTPHLLEAMKHLATQEPEKPLKFLSEFLAQKSLEIEGP